MWEISHTVFGLFSSWVVGVFWNKGFIHTWWEWADSGNLITWFRLLPFVNFRPRFLCSGALGDYRSSGCQDWRVRISESDVETPRVVRQCWRWVPAASRHVLPWSSHSNHLKPLLKRRIGNSGLFQKFPYKIQQEPTQIPFSSQTSTKVVASTWGLRRLPFRRFFFFFVAWRLTTRTELIADRWLRSEFDLPVKAETPGKKYFFKKYGAFNFSFNFLVCFLGNFFF